VKKKQIQGIGQKAPLISSIRGGLMDEKYDITYKIGNITVHVVAPPPKSKEEIEKILEEFHKAGWAIIEDMIQKGENV
jgi:hypothetical protein